MAEIDSLAAQRKQSLQRKRTTENLAQILFLIMTLISILSLVLIMVFIFGNAIPAVTEIGFKDFIMGQAWKPTANPPQFGILPMIVGSIFVTAGAIVIGVPIGVLTAIYMAYLDRRASCRERV